MKRERLLQLVMFIAVIFLILFSFLIGIVFGQFYLVLFFIVIICGFFFISIELYLRVQHNIDTKINEQRILSKQSSLQLNTKFDEVNVQLNKGTEIMNTLIELKSGLDFRFEEQKKIYEEIVDFFETMLEHLEDEKRERDADKKEREEGREEEFKNLETLKNMQSRLNVIMRQILDYEKDQTNFLNEKIGELKNASFRKRK